MRTCEPNAIVRHRFHALLGIVGLLWAGCASATVGNEDVKRDAGATGGGGGNSGGSGGSGGKGGSGGSGGATGGSSGACDPFTNSGCSSDQKCTALQVESSLVLKCGSKGSVSAGNTCERTMTNGAQTGDNCDNKLACFAIAGETSPVCRQICPTSGTANACPSGSVCGLRVSSLSDLGFCQSTTACKPLEQSGCTVAGQACYFAANGAMCAAEGNKNPGDTCNNANECKKGSTCLIVGSSGTCSSFCSTATDGSPKCTGSATGGTLCDPISGGDAVEPNLGSCRQQP